MKKIYRLNLKIGDICFRMLIDSPRIYERAKSHYKDFICNDEPKIIIDIKNVDFIKPINHKPLIKTKAWELSRKNNRYTICFPNSKKISSLTRFTDDLNYVNFYTKDDNGQLLLYLLPELLFSIILPKNKSILLHACGVLDKGRAYIFVADSGGGKSTMARLAGKRIVLNDDRIIVSKEQEIIRIYGNPWHGEIEKTINKNGIIQNIFFLEKSLKNYIFPLKKSEAVIKLFNNTFYCPSDTESDILELCCLIVEKVGCYRFGFKPDKRIWRFLDDTF